MESSSKLVRVHSIHLGREIVRLPAAVKISPDVGRRLVWNLKLETNRHIQHTLETHYRAITVCRCWHPSIPLT